MKPSTLDYYELFSKTVEIDYSEVHEEYLKTVSQLNPQEQSGLMDLFKVSPGLLKKCYQVIIDVSYMVAGAYTIAPENEADFRRLLDTVKVRLENIDTPVVKTFSRIYMNDRIKGLTELCMEYLVNLEPARNSEKMRPVYAEREKKIFSLFSLNR